MHDLYLLLMPWLLFHVLSHLGFILSESSTPAFFGCGCARGVGISELLLLLDIGLELPLLIRRTKIRCIIWGERRAINGCWMMEEAIFLVRGNTWLLLHFLNPSEVCFIVLILRSC